jgi:hypothetical protein
MIRPGIRRSPRPSRKQCRNGIPFSLFSSLTGGPGCQHRRLLLPTDENRARDHRMHSIPPPLIPLYSPAVTMVARAYKKASTPSFFPLCFLPRPATTLIEFEICISQLPTCSGDDSGEIKPSPSLSLVPLFFPLSCASDRHAVSSLRVPGRRGAPHLDITVRGRNSGEGLPKNPSTITSPASPPSPSHWSTSPGKVTTTQIPLCTPSSPMICAWPTYRLTPATSSRRYRKRFFAFCTRSSSPAPAEHRRTLRRHQRSLEPQRRRTPVRQDLTVDARGELLSSFSFNRWIKILRA